MMSLPPFIPGTHWQRPRIGRWKFVLRDDIILPVAWRLPDAAFTDAKGREWMRWVNSLIIIRKDYAWNGSSFALNTNSNLLASLYHDALYQCSGVRGFHISRAEADALMLAINRASGFRLACLYHAAVTQFGGMFWGRNKGITMEPL